MYDKAVAQIVKEMSEPLEKNDPGWWYSMQDKLGAWFNLLLLVVGAATCCGPCWIGACISNWNDNRRKQSFSTKLQRLAKARKELHKQGGDVRAAPCAICIEDFQENITFADGPIDKDAELCSCGHVFHSRCIREWTNKNDTCPVCRQAAPLIRDDALPAIAQADKSYYSSAFVSLTDTYSDVPGVRRLRARQQLNDETFFMMMMQEQWLDSQFYECNREQVRADEAYRAAHSSSYSSSSSGFGGGDCGGGGGGDGGW